ncbi:hypothetical protein [Variovorax sp. LT1R16]|uniref:hypothetical protein n=1 Tax=Variovorax sp. LT1R16 TaxID=3443728 RepID=UPI003F48D3AA
MTTPIFSAGEPDDEAIEDFLSERMTPEGRVPMIATIRAALARWGAANSAAWNESPMENQPRERYRVASEALYAALKAADAGAPLPLAPKGWKLVPKEPFPSHRIIGTAEWVRQSAEDDEPDTEKTAAVYRAMIGAAPMQPAFDGCPFCGGTKGHWEGCRAPVELSLPMEPSQTARDAKRFADALEHDGWVPLHPSDTKALVAVLRSIATPSQALPLAPSNEFEMRAILQELHDKFNTRVYGTGSYIKRDMRDRIAAVLDATRAQPQADAAGEPVVLVDKLLLEAEKFWWNDGPEGKSAEAMNAARAAVLAYIARVPQADAAEPVAKGGA